MFATRIDVQWGFRTNTGPVLFHFERVDWDRATRIVNARGYERTIREDITGLLGASTPSQIRSLASSSPSQAGS